MKISVLHKANTEVKFIPKVIHSAHGHPSAGPWMKEYLGEAPNIIPNALQKVWRKLHHIMRKTEMACENLATFPTRNVWRIMGSLLQTAEANKIQRKLNRAYNYFISDSYLFGVLLFCFYIIFVLLHIIFTLAKI